MEFELSQRLVKLIMHIKTHGFVTKDTRPFLSSFRYYGYLWILRDYGIAECDGTDENYQKIWKLTKTGMMVAEHLKQIGDLVEAKK
jgi:hypothetical protein